jgi:hypothetical protein
MIAKLVQWWDVIPGQEDDYDRFISDQYIPKLQQLGLTAKGGYYLVVGVGPRMALVSTAESMAKMGEILSAQVFKDLMQELKTYIINYSSRITEPTGRVKDGEYQIQKGVWKYIQYYDVIPGKKQEYADFISNTYLPTMETIDYVEVTQGWTLVMGSFAEITGELTFKTAVDIGRLLENPTFDKLLDEMRGNYVFNYRCRILRTTERFDEPRWYRL